ncbi:MAG: hypothetical protein KC587_16355, partial [Nitrospira sp.]|nr:hypothetical protein [Nitrospira sp.]
MITIFKTLVSVLLFVMLQAGMALGMNNQALPTIEGQAGQDIFYQTPGSISSPSVAESPQGYSSYPLVDNRLVVWFVTQQHTYFGGFVLSIPLFSLLLEFLGITRKQQASQQKLDGLAHDILRVALLSLSITALLGTFMLVTFVTLYPGFMSY